MYCTIMHTKLEGCETEQPGRSTRYSVKSALVRLPHTIPTRARHLRLKRSSWSNRNAYWVPVLNRPPPEPTPTLCRVNSWKSTTVSIRWFPSASTTFISTGSGNPPGQPSESGTASNAPGSTWAMTAVTFCGNQTHAPTSCGSNWNKMNPKPFYEYVYWLMSLSDEPIEPYFQLRTQNSRTEFLKI